MAEEVVIYIRLEKQIKDKLLRKAKSLGLTLTAFCRMTLLKEVQSKNKDDVVWRGLT